MLDNTSRPKYLRYAIILALVIVTLPCLVAVLIYTLLHDDLLAGLSAIPISTLEFLVVASIGIIPDVLSSLILLKYPQTTLANYPVLSKLSTHLVRALSVILLLYYIALQQPTGLASLGIDLKGVKVIFLLALGVFINIIFTLAYALVNKLIGNPSRATEQTIQFFGAYHSSWERIAFTCILVLLVLAEELLYRGYLIVLLGQRAQLVIFWAAVSVVLFVIIHLYQGRSTVVFYALFAVIAACLTVLTGNIIAALGMHLYQNLMSAIRIWYFTNPKDRNPGRDDLANA